MGNEYPKIQTLWKRDEKNNFRIMEGEYSRPEFSNITAWDVSEKVDGTNIRIIKEPGGVSFLGRTDNSQLPSKIVNHLEELRQPIWDYFSGRADKVILFGEGYGGKIQKGGNYRPDEAFILFDVWLDGWWLERADVADIACKLGIESVPEYTNTLDGAVSIIKSGVAFSVVAKRRDLGCLAEGIVARSRPLMLFRNGTPVMWKLKVKDYKEDKGRD